MDCRRVKRVRDDMKRKRRGWWFFGPSCEGGDAPLLENVFLPRGSNRWRWTTSDRGDQQRRSGEREASHPTEKGSGRVRWNGAEIRAWQLLFLSSAENTLLEGALGVVRGAGRALGCTRPRARGTRGLRSAGARRRWRRFGRIRWRAERIFSIQASETGFQFSRIFFLHSRTPGSTG